MIHPISLSSFARQTYQSSQKPSLIGASGVVAPVVLLTVLLRALAAESNGGITETEGAGESESNNEHRGRRREARIRACQPTK